MWPKDVIYLVIVNQLIQPNFTCKNENCINNSNLLFSKNWCNPLFSSWSKDLSFTDTVTQSHQHQQQQQQQQQQQKQQQQQQQQHLLSNNNPN